MSTTKTRSRNIAGLIRSGHSPEDAAVIASKGCAPGRTVDRGRFYVSERISPRMGRTPDGFLVCYDVPIARTGTMEYRRSEKDIMPWLATMDFGGGDVLRVERDAESVFSPQTLQSAEGKPVTIDHPPSFVDPENWSGLAKGVTQNVRRGEGDQVDLLLADLLITDSEAIKYVESGRLRQISVGYDAEYEQTGPGVAKQRNIIINHNALVRAGRAGPRCQIMDSRSDNMSGFKDKIMSMFSRTLDEMSDDEMQELSKTRDADATSEQLEKMQKTLDALSEAYKSLSAAVAAQTRDGSDEDRDDEDRDDEDRDDEDQEKQKTQDAMAHAAILTPGYTADSFGENSAAIKREILARAWVDPVARNAVEKFVGGSPNFKTMDMAHIDAALIGASVLVSQANNAAFVRGAFPTKNPSMGDVIQGLNERNRTFWEGR